MSLKHPLGKVIVKANKEQKNHFTFSNGTTIRLERAFNNLDHSYTQQTFGEVISAEEMPSGAMVLFHFNALHETYKIYNQSRLSGEEIASGDEYYAIREEECFFWKLPGAKQWNPCVPFATAKRVFKPYSGPIEGIAPDKIKDTLYVETGELKGVVVRTMKACDPVITFRNEDGVDETIIRFRPFGDEKTQREPEAIAIDDVATEMVNSGKYFIGLTSADAKPLNAFV